MDGEILDERFELGSRLGAGGFGEVYRATQLSTGQQVAVKLIRPEVLRDAPEPETLRERFRRETAIVASLNHPHVVSLIDAGEADDGRLYAAYEFVKGETLTAYLERRGALSEHRTKLIMSQVLDALAAAHKAGVVHRDLKPDNIMLRQGHVAGMTHVVVLDFGIATLQAQARGERDWQTLTSAGAMPGTPSYMAPEQVTSPREVGPWSDVYAWGLIFCECLRGERVYVGETAGAVMLLQASPTPVPLPASLEGTPLGELVTKASAKRPEDRFGDARDALEALSPHVPFSTRALMAVVPAHNDPITQPLKAHHDPSTERFSTTPLGEGHLLRDARDRLEAALRRALDSDRALPLALSFVGASVLALLVIIAFGDGPQPPVTASSTPDEPVPAAPSPPPSEPAQALEMEPGRPAPRSAPRRLCDQGRVPVNGHCCWPAQHWDAHTQTCTGTPTCPTSTLQRPASCIPLNSQDMGLLERCKPFDDKGDTTACQILATHLKINQAHAAAADIFRVSCERQNGPGCTGAAGALRKLNRHDEARQLLKIGCDLNHANACHTLAWDYQYGRHVARDWSLAESLYQRACGPGNPFTNACQALARYYLEQARQAAPEHATDWHAKAKTYLRRCAPKRAWCELTLSKLDKDTP